MHNVFTILANKRFGSSGKGVHMKAYHVGLFIMSLGAMCLLLGFHSVCNYLYVYRIYNVVLNADSNITICYVVLAFAFITTGLYIAEK